MTATLPIEAALPELLAALKTHGQAVLQAPPGAGKTTRVPLALLEENLVSGRILMLEPRRLATRAAAERMATTLGKKAGQTIGYRIRGESNSGEDTRIEVVTEGILTRIIQSDPSLTGVGAVVFDEFHERSIHADLGLALCLEIRGALREDLMLLVMSATLDAEPVATLMGDAPVITSQGQSFSVTTRWLDRPWSKPGERGPRFEQAVADLVKKALSETEGGILVFLPGEGEIRRTQSLLAPALPENIHLHTLFGAMDFKAQRAAISPSAKGRKIVLATSIAETSLTIEDIRVVVDGGRTRRARFDPASGMSRLVTERVTKAEATQRQGRAGRVAEGICYCLWTKGEEGGFAPFPPAEIETADLAPLVLETAMWGARTPSELPFLTPPRERTVTVAQELLQVLGALDQDRAVTGHGRQIARLPLHPRLAHMVLKGGKDAPALAAILSDRDILNGAGEKPFADLSLRLEAVRDTGKFRKTRPFDLNQAALSRVKTEMKRIRPSGTGRLSVGEMAALAYPDRVGLHRGGEEARYILSGGKGAYFNLGEALANNRLIVATDLDGDKRDTKIRLAASISEGELRTLFQNQITTQHLCEWSKRERRVVAQTQEVFGALTLSAQNWHDCPDEARAEAMVVGIRELGFSSLPMNKAARLLISRVEWLRTRGTDMPDFSEDGLLTSLETWLAPALGKSRNVEDLKKLNIVDALMAGLLWEQRQTLDRLAPASITAPTGTRLAVDYSGEAPSVSVRLQEMFGLTRHPTVGPGKLPLLIELLSPARRPVQTTADLPGFWASSYSDVRKDMRGRYPKHPWPDDPTAVAPTRRVKPK